MLNDAHPVVRAGLRTILAAFPDISVVAEGADGEAALSATREEVDIVVCDIQMPGMDGITATRRLRAADGPPELILTTYATQADIVAADEAGALGYLLKDAPEQALHDAVVATAAGRRTLAPEVADALAERMSRPAEALSAREIEILRALETGAGNRELAKMLFISEATVKTHLVHIFQKLGVGTRTAAITAARERRVI